MRDAAIDTHRSPARGSARPRGAGAPPLDDMVGEGPVARGAPRRGGITSAAVAAQRLGGGRSAARVRGVPSFAARLRGRLPRIRPLKALTVGAFGVALVGIVANAMVFQRGHHPSPLFGLGRSVDGSADAAQRTAAAVPAPPCRPRSRRPERSRPRPRRSPTRAAAVAMSPKPAPAHHAAKPHHEEAKAKTADAPAVTHPRPGHPAPAHAKAEPKTVGTRTVEAKTIETKPEKVDAKADPVAKLLAGGAHPPKPEPKPVAAKPPSKPEAKLAAAAEAPPPGKAATAPAAHPHHRLAATAPATETE